MYITVQSLWDEGVSKQSYTDVVLQEKIALAQTYIERITGFFFEKRAGFSFKLDGTGHDLLWLPVPPVDVNGVTSVTIGGETLDTEYYEVQLEMWPSDGRMNPKLRRLSGSWTKGKSNIVITGDFGYVDSDGGDTPVYSTPGAIKNCCKRIAILLLPNIADVEAQRAARIVEESLKDYRYRLSESRGGFFGDENIDRDLELFRRTRMATV